VYKQEYDSTIFYATLRIMAKARSIRALSIERLEALCDEKGITLGQLARHVAHLDRSQATEWKKRGTIPGGDKIEAICFYFGVSPAYLFGRTPQECADYMSRVSEREFKRGLRADDNQVPPPIAPYRDG
jgi:hypothetical protein